MEDFNFTLPPLRYDNDEVATENFLTNFINNVFSFGNVSKQHHSEEIIKFKEMLCDPKYLFGNLPEPAQFPFALKPVIIDTKKSLISIHNLNFKLLFKHIKDTYGEKHLNTIFYKTYALGDIKKFNNKKIGRNKMKITSLITPLFFALELSILFSQLYKKYRNKKYQEIAIRIYKDSWLSKSDNQVPESVDINYASSLLADKYVLQSHQIKFIEDYPKWKAQLNLRGIYNAFDQGLGKTLTAMSLAMALHVDKVYVVCPNTLVANWYNEILAYYDGKIIPHDCKNTAKPKKNTRVFIVNNESIKKILPYVDTNCKSMLIVDEGHNFRSLNSSRVDELLNLKNTLNPTDILPMSGTPLKASPNELVPALLLIDPLFTKDAAVIYNKCFNFNDYQAMEIVTARLGKVIYRKLKSDVLQLPEKNISNLPMRIPNYEPFLMKNIHQEVLEKCAEIAPTVLKENDEILNKFQDLINKYSTAGMLNTKWYLRRICRAANYTDSYTIETTEHELDVERITKFLDDYVISNPNFPKNLEKTIKDYEKKLIHFDRVIMGRAIGKIYPVKRLEMFSQLWLSNEDYFINEIQNNIKKTVIFSQVYGVIPLIAKRLESAGIKTVTVTGKVNTSNRALALRKFKEDESVRVILATSQSMGTGVTLTEASLMFFFGAPWRSTDYDQCCDRIYRIGQDVDVNIWNVLLDTPEYNLSDRMDKIMQWSSNMFHSAIDTTIVEESFIDSEISLDGYIFNETPIYLNIDKWKSGVNNILYVTGLSGSGKSYFSKTLAEKFPCTIVLELDKFENYPWYINKEEKHPAVKRGDKLIYDYLRNHYNDLSIDVFNNDYTKYVNALHDFYIYILDYAAKHPKLKFVIEGIQLFADEPFKLITNKDSVIIIRKSIATSMRKLNTREHATIRNRIHTFIDGQKKLNRFIKHLCIDTAKYAVVAGNEDVAFEALREEIAINPLNKFKSPKELYDWMKFNIKCTEFTELKSPFNLVTSGSGSCHDQTAFEIQCLLSMKVPAAGLFVIESNKSRAGMTHSLAVFNMNNKYYWFENSLGDMNGVREFNSIDDIKNVLYQMHNSGLFGNNNVYPILRIVPFKYNIGDNLQKIINRCFNPR